MCGKKRRGKKHILNKNSKLKKQKEKNGRKNKNYSTLAHGSQRHSFGGLVVHKVVPPPAKYKAVHFAPNVEVSKRDKTPSPEEADKVPDMPIPTEGLPTRPARAPPKLPKPRTSSAPTNTASVIIPNTSETVPIVVKNISDYQFKII